MSVILDPTEVRYHLQQMGFNVSDMQLMQFMKDLKKLIKHDQKHKCTCHCKDSHYESLGGSSYAESSVTSSVGSTSSGGYYADKENMGVRARHRSRSQTAEYSDLDGDTGTVASVKTHEGRQPRSRSRNSSTDPLRGRSSDRVSELKKSKSSFIRTRDSSRQRASQRCDPVTLYHKYQSLWQQQKAPGEDNHADLRWSIRERMLGAEVHPQPRPSSRAPSVEVLIRRHTRM